MTSASDTSAALASGHEHEQWSELFRRELEASNPKLYSSYWWKTYYDEMMHVVTPLLTGNNPKVLEAGSGSGKGSILLGKTIDRTLLDISRDALKFAKLIAKKFKATNLTYVEGDIFRLPFKKKSFDLVWNVGVLEHYEQADATKILESMISVTKPGGYVVIGVPNFRSPPIIKAKALNYPLLRFLPGYKLDSELDYSIEELHAMTVRAADSCGRSIGDKRVESIGMPLFVESPKFIVKTLGRLTAATMPDRKFLRLLVYKIR